MENALKALLIAAGVIMAGLIISALLAIYSRISTFYEQEHNMTVIEQTEKFNSNYENYHGKEINGTELISLMNRIIDYNNLQADMEGYERIVINVDMHGLSNTLAYDGNNADLIGDPINNSSNDRSIKDLAGAAINITLDAANNNIEGLTETKLRRLSEEISSIVDIHADEENARAQTISKILGDYDDSWIGFIEEALLKYEQLKNFRKARFRCNNVHYDVNTGRVDGMEFEVLLEEDISGNKIIKLK